MAKKDEVTLEGFQADANLFAGIEPKVAVKLPVEWPDSLHAIMTALTQDAEIPHTDAAPAAQTLWTFRPVEDAAEEQAPAAVSPQAGPMVVQLHTGNPIEMKTRDLVQTVADGERDSDFTNELNRRTNGWAVFVRVSGEEGIDVDATMEVIDFVDFDDPDSVPDEWDMEPTETLNDVIEKRKLANPITGEALAKGDPWLKLTEERRILAAFGRINRDLTGNEDEITLINELNQEDPGVRWTPIQRKYDRAKKGRKEEALLAQQAIYYRKERAGRTAGGFCENARQISGRH